MHIQVVSFSLDGMSDEEYAKACNEVFVPAMLSVPGLISKIWLRDAENNTYGGVYTWRDRKAMEDFFQSDIFKAFASNPSFANITSRDFGVMEGPTRATSGRVQARA